MCEPTAECPIVVFSSALFVYTVYFVCHNLNYANLFFPYSFCVTPPKKSPSSSP